MVLIGLLQSAFKILFMSSKVSFMFFLQWNNKIGLAVFMEVHSGLVHRTIVLCEGVMLL